MPGGVGMQRGWGAAGLREAEQEVCILSRSEAFAEDSSETPRAGKGPLPGVSDGDLR